MRTLFFLSAIAANAHANKVTDDMADNVADNVVDRMLKVSYLNNMDLGIIARQLCKEEQIKAGMLEDRSVSPARRLSVVRSLPAFCSLVSNAQLPRRNLMTNAASLPSFLPSFRPVAPRSSTVQHAFSLFTPAIASELDVLSQDEPGLHVLDDASALSKSTKNALSNDLSQLESRRGFDLDIATVRKLDFETDAFSFAEKLFETWHPDATKDKAGLLVIVKASGDGAFVAGDAFMAKVGDTISESVVADNLVPLAEEGKINEAILSSVKRITAALDGKEDIPPPVKNTQKATRTFKTKEETAKKKGISTTVVGSLLVIAFVVPMLQYFGYVNKS